MSYVALDFETATGSHNSACALGMVKFDGDSILDEFYTLINPPVVKFDLFNIGIHGIHQEDVKDSPTFADISGSVMAFIGDSVVMAHNAGFDLKVLKATARYDGIELPDMDYICTYIQGEKLFYYLLQFLQDFQNLKALFLPAFPYAYAFCVLPP